MARFTCQRVLITEAPFGELDAGRGWIEQGIWPAFWITHPSAPAVPCRMEYRLNVSVAGSGATTMRLHTAGDEHYEFRVDGALAGWGSERGTVAHWYFDTYDLTLEPGDHCLTAKVTAAGKCALRSQMSVVPAFLLAAEKAGFSTGEAAWEVRHLEGLDFEKPFDHDFFSVGWNSIHDAARRVAAGEGWQPARALHPGSTAGRRNRHADIHLLAPAVLPVSGRAAFSGGVVRHVSPITTGPVRDTNHRPDEAGSWAAWWDDDEPLILPPGQQRRVLFDLQDYVCAWPQLEVSGGCGARVRIFWAESLSETEGSAHKGNRAALEGKTFSGLGDTFLPDGSSAHTFDGPFIRAGRYVEMIVTAGEEPLVLNAIRLLRAEYPLEISARFATKLACVEPLLERCRRTVRASCHDSLIDGPYYEQMGWIGDTAQVSLTLYSMSADTRLVRKALDVFDRSRLPCGMIRARWPARDSLVLPPYAMCWINVLHDFSWWRNEPGFVQDRLPGMRAILDGLLGRVDETDGLLRIPSGWNFTDWVHGWDGGIPPRDPDGAGAVLQWQLAWTLRQAAHLEENFGEPELAARFIRLARRTAEAAEVFWDEERGLYSNRRARETFSEHAQAYAALSGLIPRPHLPRVKKGLVDDGSLTRATDPFTHYLFEAFVRLGLRNHIWPRLQRGFTPDSLGLLTTPEGPEPTRSDCHAWGAHPHYHLFASLLGLRPAAPGFQRVRIDPLWDLLQDVSGQLPHPDGPICFHLSWAHGKPQGEVTLPPTVTGTLVYPDGELALRAGTTLLTGR